MPDRVRHAQKIVIKIGTSILRTRGESFSHKEHARVCQEIYALIKKGRRPVLVSSGAIALGMKCCGFKKRPKEMAQLQACAAIKKNPNTADIPLMIVSAVSDESEIKKAFDFVYKIFSRVNQETAKAWGVSSVINEQKIWRDCSSNTADQGSVKGTILHEGVEH